MEIIDYDGHEWMRGLGFPGWSNARWSIFMTAIAGTPALIGCWQLAHQQRDWSHAEAIAGTLVDLLGLVLVGLAATVVSLFAIAGLREWSTVYLIRTQAGAIIIEFQRYWGLWPFALFQGLYAARARASIIASIISSLIAP
jgi:hypothetical protein